MAYAVIRSEAYDDNIRRLMVTGNFSPAGHIDRMKQADLYRVLSRAGEYKATVATL